MSHGYGSKVSHSYTQDATCITNTRKPRTLSLGHEFFFSHQLSLTNSLSRTHKQDTKMRHELSICVHRTPILDGCGTSSLCESRTWVTNSLFLPHTYALRTFDMHYTHGAPILDGRVTDSLYESHTWVTNSLSLPYTYMCHELSI